MLTAILTVIVYTAGCCIAYGVTNGIREGIEGIGDMFNVFLWPIALIFLILFSIAQLLVHLGNLIRRS